MGPEYTQLQKLVKSEGLHTVCQEAGCPNIFECWEDREATFLIGGDQCTRRCDFCQIDTGKPADARPRRAAPGRRVRRDDGPALRDGHRRRPRRPARRGRLAVRRDRPRRSTQLNPGTGVEMLAPDFSGDPELLGRGVRRPARGVRAQRGDRAAHLQAHPPRVPLRALPRRDHAGPRGRADHQVQPDPGHGRGRAPRSARRCRTCTTAGSDIITITQYLRPTARHHPVERWVKPEEFVELQRARPRRSASSGVMSGPLVRSSYRAGRLWAQRCAGRAAHPRALAHIETADHHPPGSRQPDRPAT